MGIGRRGFMMAAGAPLAIMAASGLEKPEDASNMYGLIGKMIAIPGQRDGLIAVLLEGTGGMPGSLSYVIAKDSADENAIWITEVWDSEASHAASLSLPSVKSAIAKGRPLIAGFGEPIVTIPVGGHGLKPRQ